MKRVGLGAVALVLLLCTGPLQAGSVGYTLDVTTTYSDSLPAGTLTPFGGPSPDTGYYTITNNGTSTFTGTVGQLALAGNGGNYNFTSGTITLAAGQSIAIAVNSESSNQGGYNGPFGTVQPGVTIQINGSVTDGVNTQAVGLSVNDADIHSGAPRTNPFGVTLDSYVLQGGDNLGRDTGDGYEETQASGHFEFFDAGPSATPEPASMTLFGIGALGMAGYAWRRRKVVA
jgi:hypothetical protein